MVFSVNPVNLCWDLSKMGVSCKGVCDRYKSTGTSMQFKYQEGQKRCTSCGIFIKCDGVRCPCCNMKLRTNARNRLSKIKRLENVYQ